MKKKLCPWLIVVCCCGFAAASIGLTMNCAGVFYSPVAQSLNVGIGDVSLYLTILNLTSGLVGPYTVKLLQKIRLQYLALAGAMLVIGGYVAFAYTTAVWQFYLLAFLMGVGNSAIGLVMVTVVIGNWFHKRMGIAEGLAMAFSGLIGVVFSPVISSLITAYGWRNAYLGVAGLVALSVLPTLFFIRLKPEELGMLPYGAEEKTVQTEAPKEKEESKAILATPIFPLFCVIAFAGAFVTGMGSHMSGFGTHSGLSVQGGAFMISMVMVGNTAAKMLAGVSCDAIGPKRTCLVILGLVGTGLAMLCLIPSHFVGLLMVGAMLVGTTYCITNVVLSTMMKELCGEGSFGILYSNVSIVSFLGSAVAYAAIGYCFDLFGSYVPTLILCFVIVAAAAVCTLAAYRIQKSVA